MDHPAVAYIMAGKLKIRDRSAKLVTLMPTRIQRKVLRQFNESFKAGIPHRSLELKPRQVKLSSIVAGILYADARTQDGRCTLVAANQAGTVDDLWSQKYQTFKRHEEPEPETLYDSKKTMRFKDTDSAIDIRIGSPDLGRGGTRQNLHITEFPYMENPEEIWAEVTPCVPYEPNTAIFLESTGAKPGDRYETMFREAWKARETGTPTEYQANFYSWPECEEYEIELAADKAKQIERELTTEERGLVQKHKLTIGNIMWRRMKLRELGGDLAKFCNRYPMTPDEAFSARRESCFDPDALHWYRTNTVCDPESMPRGQRAAVRLTPSRNPIIEAGGAEAPLWVWLSAANQCTYTMYVDVAGDFGEESTKYHSQSAMAVVEDQTGEVVATWVGRQTPIELAATAYALGKWYNLATLVLEANNHGHATFHELMRLNYPRMWWNNAYSGVVAEKQMSLTLNVQTRKTIIATMQDLVRERRLGIRCPRLLAQMETFEAPLAGSQRARKGHRDDLVIATAGASWVASKGRTWATREPTDRMVEGNDPVRREARNRKTFDSLLDSSELDRLSGVSEAPEESFLSWLAGRN